MDINAEAVLKLWGPFGMIVMGLVVFIWKKLLPDLEKQQQAYRDVLTSALDDARKERDQERNLRQQELNRYMDSLKYRDDRFKEVADAINQVRTPPRRRE